MGTPHGDLRDRVRAHLDRALPPGARVVVALSGGPDSAALLHLVAAARPDLPLVAVHVRHHLRDDAHDVVLARAQAAAVGAAFELPDADVGAGAGPEDAARRARHRLLRRAAADHDAAAVLFGHTADDQAETVLLRIARGTGLDGLAGIPRDAVHEGVRYLRPLLGERRADVRAVVADTPTATDPTNLDPDQRRARARHHALTVLRGLHPAEADPVPALARLADLAAAEVTALDAATAGATQVLGAVHLVPRDPDRPAPLTARLLRRAVAAVGDGHPPTAAALAALVDLPAGRGRDLPADVRVTAGRHGWVVLPSSLTLPARPLPPDGSWVDLPEVGLTVRCAPAPPAPPAEPRGVPVPTRWRVAVPAADGLVVRGRRPAGDRAARRALQRWPAGMRHVVPLVVAADHIVLAVAGRALVAPEGPAVVVEVRPRVVS